MLSNGAIYAEKPAFVKQIQRPRRKKRAPGRAESQKGDISG